MNSLSSNPVALDHRVTLAQAFSIVSGQRSVAVSEPARDRCAASHARLCRVITEKRHVYGITTGFGPLANRLIDPEAGEALQQNLVYHLATGLGSPMSWQHARAMVLSRLVSILNGNSGASLETIDLLVNVLNAGMAPVIPERGTVGASGDLTPLAHMVLALQGQGGFIDADGCVHTGADGLSALGVVPLHLKNRDGLALVNGTSAMTGLAICNARLSKRLLDWAMRLSAALAEVMRARAEAWSTALADLRPHAGQIDVTRTLNDHLSGSGMIETSPIANRRLGAQDIRTEAVAGQDAYSIRTVPQVLGAVCDTMSWHDQITETELNGVSDNPVFPDAGESIAIHGGNFMGQHIALTSDALSNALCVMAGLAERQIARLTDERLNDGLPAFLHSGQAGLNSGLMGAQVTATATLSEMRGLGPASVHSISTNAANQDVVSMGTVAARRASQIGFLTSDVLAILALAVAQAADLMDRDQRQPFSPNFQKLRTRIRSVSQPISEDRPLSSDIKLLSDMIARVDLALH